MVPAEVRVGTVPVLGTGKVDFVGVTKLVREAAAKPAPVAVVA